MTAPQEAPVLVAGASGYLGGHLAAFLVRRGYQVRALVRPTSDTSRLQAPGIELRHGDLTDTASLVAAMKGVRAVFNCAAKISDWGPKEAFLAINRDGAANLVAAAQQAGVERLVHFSSLTVLGLPRAGELITEDSPYASGPLDKYTHSKLEGEKVVREAHGQQGLSTVIVRPGAIWGPGDPHILPRIVALLRRGRMVYIGGGTNHVALSHVENLSLGMALAAEVPAATGRVYHVVDEEDLTSREVIDGLVEGLGTPKPMASVPFWLVYGAAGAMEVGAQLFGSTKAPPMSRYGVRLVASDCRYDRSRAGRELGYRAIVSFRQGVAGLKAN
ncbi:MAG: NAD-dependent epimerase/dehydratase family protein [Myxococcales bacterium]